MNHSKYLTTAALVIAVMGISAISAFAATEKVDKADRPSFEEMQAKWEEMEAKREKIDAAVEAGDYDAWYALMTEDDRDPKILDIITEDKFDDFARAHDLMNQAKEIFTELGLDEPGMGFGGAFGGPGHMGRGGMMRGFGPLQETTETTTAN